MEEDQDTREQPELKVLQQGSRIVLEAVGGTVEHPLPGYLGSSHPHAAQLAEKNDDPGDAVLHQIEHSFRIGAAQADRVSFRSKPKSPNNDESDESSEQAHYSSAARRVAQLVLGSMTPQRGFVDQQPRTHLQGSNYVYNLCEDALYCVPPENNLRRNVFFFIDHTYFEGVVLFLITFNIVTMVLDTPGIRELPGIEDTVFILEIFFQALFTIEMLLKMFALGVVMHEYSYLRSIWNVTDFCIVIFGFVVYFLDRDFRSLRLLRVFRLLKALSKVSLLKSISVALVNSGPKMRDVTMLMTFVVVVMAILGLELFLGAMQQRCYFYVNTTTGNGTYVMKPMLDPLDPDVCSMDPSIGGHSCSRGAQCATHLDVYIDPYLNFDNIGNAIFYVLKLVTMDNWPVDNLKMQESNGFGFFIYSFAVVIFGSYFCLNLVLAILSSEYENVTAEMHEEEKNKQKELLMAGVDEDEMMVDDDDDDESDLGAPDPDADDPNRDGQTEMADQPDADELSTKFSEVSGRKEKTCIKVCREAVLQLVLWKWFARVILFVTIINVLCLGLFHHNIDPTFLEVLDIINMVCSFIFIVEMLLKIFAMGFKYFMDGYNIFDCLLVLISIPEIVIGLQSGSGGGSAFSALRAFRLARVLRVLNSSMRMRQLMITVADSAKSSSFLFLFLFLFILTMSLFAVNFLNDSIDEAERPNFTTLPDTLLGLFVVLTGEDWVEIGIVSMSGSSWGAVFFFYIYYFIGNYLLLNFVIVILITSFNRAADRLREDEAVEKLEEVREHLEHGADPANFENTGKFNDDDDDDTIRPSPHKPSKDASQGQEEKNNKQKEKETGGTAEVPDLLSMTRDPEASNDPTPDDAPAAAAAPGGQPQHGKRGPLESDSPKVTPPTSGRMRGGLHTKVDPIRMKVRVFGEDDLGHLDEAEAPAPDTGRSSGNRSYHKALAVSEENVPIAALHLPDKDFQKHSEFYLFIRALMPTIDDEATLRKRIKGKSFFIFDEESKLRYGCAWIAANPYFEALVFVIILWSCILLGFDNPASMKDPDIMMMVDISGYILVAFFFIEAMIRSIAWGMWYGEDTYLSDSWNRIDFLVLIFSIVSIPVPELRATRSFRVFRLAAKVQALRVVIEATLFAMPGIANVALLILFNFVVFGILGVQLFAGEFVKCTDDSIDYIYNCTGTYNVTKAWYETINGTAQLMTQTVEEPRIWQHSFFNFNHVGIATLTLFQQMMGDGWSVVMYDGMDSRSTELGMEHNSRPYIAFFFVVFMIVGNFFLINLFVGSLIDSFSAERNTAAGRTDKQGNKLLTDGQDQWIRSFSILSATKLLPTIPKPLNCFRKMCVLIYFSDDERIEARASFEWLITGAILLNAALMCIRHANEPQELTDFVFWANFAFACLYLVEAIIKIVALMPVNYFADSWNRFDFVLVPVAFVSQFAGGPGTNAIRVLRVARVLRLVKRAKGLKRLFDSLLYALPQLMNITLLLMLVLFVFSVVGVALFATVLIDPMNDFPLSEYFNFHNAGNGVILLFQIATTESWSDVMEACAMTPETSGCRYEDNNCGNWGSIPFFTLFMLASNSVALNLFIFVIVDNYMEVNQLNDPHTELLFQRLSIFRTQWSLWDRQATHLLKFEPLVIILRRTLRDSKSKRDEDNDEDITRLRSAIQEDQVRGTKSVLEQAADENPNNRFIKAVRDESDATFMRHLRVMDIPMDRHGKVRYVDCVYGLTKDYYQLDEVAAKQAARFLQLHEEDDPNKLADCFKVHHALAVRKLVRVFREKRRRRRLVLEVGTKLLGLINKRRKRRAGQAQNGGAIPTLTYSSPPTTGSLNLMLATSSSSPLEAAENLESPRAQVGSKTATPVERPKTPESI